MEDPTGNKIKDICVDNGIDPVQSDVKRQNRPYLFSEETDEKPYMALGRLLQEEREIFSSDPKQNSQNGELIPLEEFNRRYCAAQSSDSGKEESNRTKSDDNRCSHQNSTLDDQGTVTESDQSTSAAFGLEGDDEFKPPNSHTNQMPSSLWKHSSDHPGSFDSSFLSHQGLYSNQGYPGNLSLRSESSTTSTHSFAFPVLQSEWNGSPVRMARVNRQRMQSRWRWVPRISCFKF